MIRQICLQSLNQDLKKNSNRLLCLNIHQYLWAEVNRQLLILQTRKLWSHCR